jgi:hypothetical protein
VRPMAVRPATRDGRATRLMIWAAFAIVASADFGYLLIIRAQDSSISNSDASRVAFVAWYFGLMAAMLAVSLLNTPFVARFRPALRAGAGVGLLAIGTLALMSIGLVLLVAGVLATIVAVRSAVMTPQIGIILSELAAASVAIIILVIGFDLFLTSG